VQPAVDAKSIQLESDLDTSVESIWGDSERLQQVVLNLLSNAIKFTPESGRVTVRLSTVNGDGLPQAADSSQLTVNRQPTQPPTTRSAQIQVSDTGIGISPEFLPYVFDRFHQADSTSARSNKGLGLGLAIARHLVELHGGTIQAESPGIGQGATFTVKLPFRAIPSSEDAPASNPDQMPPPTVGEDAASSENPSSVEGLRVLVVDDEADARQWIVTVLEQCGAEVIAVGSVSEALAALEQSQPDVLVSDIGLPGEDGYALIRKIRELEPEMGRRIPAVALTGYARVEDYRKALAEGFQLHVAKPIRAAELIAVVASLAKMAGKL
jgi:CheY-like chemotaxis protein